MRLASTLALALALAGTAGRAGAQGDKDLLPMSFVKVDSATAQQLEGDWNRLRELGKEWAYCVENWELQHTKDVDTIFVITAVRRIVTRSGKHEVADFTCASANGLSMPIAHAHPGGDCSPSRADATYAVAHGTPFGLILCGPRSTAGYTSKQFLWISRGVLTERGAYIAADGGRPQP